MREVILILLGVSLFALVINLPFGYMRSRSPKFSLKWLLYIHLPIPFIFILRTVSGLDYRAIPVILTGAVAGQLLGGLMNRRRDP